MNDTGYINISRQAGLLRELSMIANNIANISTTGYRREGAVFSEYVKAQGKAQATNGLSSSQDSTSIGNLAGHFSDFTSGDIKKTGGTFDLAIDGDGFFSVGTPDGPFLTRAGNFMLNKDGALITPAGYNVLDDAGSPIQIPPGATAVAIAGDGTISADGSPVGRIGVLTAPQGEISRIGDNLLMAEGGGQPSPEARVLQGFLEGSNVNPVLEIARLIEVQRSYEVGQKLLDIDNDRISKVITAMRQM